MKACSKCSRSKPLDDFYKNPRSPDGRRGDCRVCVLAERRKRYTTDGGMRERLIAYARKYQRDRPGYNSELRRRNPEKVQARERRYYLKSQYGMTEGQVDAMFRAQGSVCAICQGDEPGRSWSVDHDHVTGVVRGVLCWHCNVALGHFRDDVVSLAAAIDYLLNRRGGEDDGRFDFDALNVSFEGGL